jgi:eukaryotic-like serine/threonine-protein kinase
MQISSGTRLGPYEVIARIGAGGMGEVYRARDTRLDREVAVKVLPPGFTTDQDRLHRFEQEARAAGTLNHPNLVTVFDIGSHHGAPYVVMELLEGESLRQKLAGDGGARIPVRKAVDYSVQVAQGLAAAHEHGVIHRDLKPDNIFVTDDGRVKILDFGLAKLFVRKDDERTDASTQLRDTSPGIVVGTAGYMSPEQVKGLPVDHRSDIFSFGAVLYEMVTGRRAFKGDSSVETMNAILKEDPPEITGSQPNVSPALDLVVRHCLEKNPVERFQSARDLAFDLQRVSATSGSAPAIAIRPAVTKWVVPVTAAVVVVALIALWHAGYRLMRAPAAAPTAPTQRQFTLLTYQAGVEQFPSLAPDGKTFVFVSNAAGNADIYLQRVGGRNAINLTKDSPVDDKQPAFSPDGSQIAFRSEREGGGIFIMGATGESVHRLTNFGFNPSWSPDGSEIAVGGDSIDLTPQSRPQHSVVSIVNVRTGARRTITKIDAVQPSWSPHGDRIAFWGLISGGGQRDIFTIDPHAPDPNQTITRITSDIALDWNPAWSADGKYLYFGSDRDGTMNLWRVPIDERSGNALGPIEQISLPTRFGAHFTVARNTGSLAYSGVDISDTIWRIPIDPLSLRVNGEPSRVLGGAMTFLGGGEVSPDGKWIAISNLGRQEDIILARTDSSESRLLTNDPERDRGPSWSPDGKTLYFYSQRGGDRYEIWSINFDGSGLRQISHTTGNSIWFPKLMPGGRALYVYNDVGASILPLDPDGLARRIEPLPPMPEGLRFRGVDLSRDGKRFVGAGAGTGLGSGLWLYSLDTKKYDRLTERGNEPHWLPDSKRILYHDGPQMFVVDAASKQVRPLPLPRAVRSATVASDGRTLYVVEQSAEADIWLMQQK